MTFSNLCRVPQRLHIFLLFSLILSVLTLGAQTIASSWAGGSGTEEDPYQISDISQLRKLAADCNGGKSFLGTYFCLTNDIRDNDQVLDENGDLISNYASLRVWTSIANNEARPFKGVFDGRNHYISGIYTGKREHDQYGNIPIKWDGNETSGSIFKLAEIAIIKNVRIKDSFYSSLIYKAKYSQIENCINWGTAMYPITHSAIGTLVKNCGNYGIAYGAGIANGGFKFVNCFNYGEIRISFWPSGGICASSGMIYNCMNYGRIINTYGSNRTGGICRMLEFFNGVVNMDNCVNYGDIEPFENSLNGGVIGFAENERTTTINNIYWIETSAPSYYASSGNGCLLTGEALKMTADEMKSDEFLAKLNSNAASIGEDCCGWKRGRDGFPILEIIEEEGAGIDEAVVEDTTNSDAPIVYYNMQGMPVSNPGHGIFIKVQGSHSTKVAL